MAETEWTWFFARSEDDEQFHHAKSREDAVAQGAEMFDGEPFHICEARRADLRDDFFDFERVLEEFEEHNEEAWGEDGPDGRVTAAAKTELVEALTAAFSAWRAKHKPYTAWALHDFRSEETIAPVSAST